MRRSQRLVFWLIASLISLPLFIKGHHIPINRDGVTFLHLSSHQIIIRINGDVSSAGIYRFPDRATVITVTKMTINDPASKIITNAAVDTPLRTGDVVTVRLIAKQTYEVTVGYMNAKERMLLSIPLDPNLMFEADWDALPGIGPELAKRIVVYRQHNGDFESFNALIRVPGLGEKKISSLRGLFTRR